MAEHEEVRWPKTPEPLQREDGVKWQITNTLRYDGALIAYCNEVPFCVLRPVDKQKGTWHVPGFGTVKNHLEALQKAAEGFLGPSSKYATQVKC